MDIDLIAGRRELDEMDASEQAKYVKPVTWYGRFWRAYCRCRRLLIGRREIDVKTRGKSELSIKSVVPLHPCATIQAMQMTGTERAHQTVGRMKTSRGACVTFSTQRSVSSAASTAWRRNESESMAKKRRRSSSARLLPKQPRCRVSVLRPHSTHHAAAERDRRAGVGVERAVLAQPAGRLEREDVGEVTTRARLERRLRAHGVQLIRIGLVAQAGVAEEEHDVGAGGHAVAEDHRLNDRLARADVGDAADAQDLPDDGLEERQVGGLWRQSRSSERAHLQIGVRGRALVGRGQLSGDLVVQALLDVRPAREVLD